MEPRPIGHRSIASADWMREVVHVEAAFYDGNLGGESRMLLLSRWFVGFLEAVRDCKISDCCK